MMHLSYHLGCLSMCLFVKFIAQVLLASIHISLWGLKWLHFSSSFLFSFLLLCCCLVLIVLLLLFLLLQAQEWDLSLQKLRGVPCGSSLRGCLKLELRSWWMSCWLCFGMLPFCNLLARVGNVSRPQRGILRGIFHWCVPLLSTFICCFPSSLIGLWGIGIPCWACQRKGSLQW